MAQILCMRLERHARANAMAEAQHMLRAMRGATAPRLPPAQRAARHGARRRRF